MSRRALEKYRPIVLHVGLSSWAAQGHEGNVATLLAAGAPPNLPSQGSRITHDTPLHQAAYLCHPGIVRRLVAAGALVHDERFNGFTALHCWVEGISRQDPGDGYFFATEEQIVETGAVLLCAGADPDRQPDRQDAVSVTGLLVQHDRMEWLEAAQSLASSWLLTQDTPPATAGDEPPIRL